MGAYFLVRHLKRDGAAPFRSNNVIKVQDVKMLSPGFGVFVVEVSGVSYHVFKSANNLIVRMNKGSGRVCTPEELNVLIQDKSSHG